MYVGNMYRKIHKVTTGPPDYKIENPLSKSRKAEKRKSKRAKRQKGKMAKREKDKKAKRQKDKKTSLKIEDSIQNFEL